MKFTVIGNMTDPKKDEAADGGRIKVALYKNILIKEGFDVESINLNGWKKRILSTIFKIRKAVKRGDTILIMGGPNGARALITLCLFFNKKKKAKLIFPMLGTGVIEQKSKKLSIEKTDAFFNGESTFGIKDEKMGKKLEKLDLILAQTDVLVDFYKNFYKISNIQKVVNFRVIDSRPRVNLAINKERKFIFFARVNAEKGIFHLLETFNKIISNGAQCSLDIYGFNELNKEEFSYFNSLLSEKIQYKGVIENKDSLLAINNYDFLVFPSIYHGEGTPGTVSESFLAGVPVLSSNFHSAREIISNGSNGILYKINDSLSLEEKLKQIISMNDEELIEFKKAAYNTGNMYYYDNYKSTFLGFFTNA